MPHPNHTGAARGPLPPEQNLILTGFMGTGKTTVGQILAQRLGRPFVDMDAQLEALFGKPIPQIFAEEGEETFRAAEARLCQELSRQQGLVIATGGGALMDPSSREALARSGPIVCLTAEMETLLERLDRAQDRPLLSGDRERRRGQIQALLARRQGVYAGFALQVDTDERTPEEVVERILELLALQRWLPDATQIPVPTPQGTYPIYLGSGLVEHLPELLAQHRLPPGPVAVVADRQVAAHHGETVVEALSAAGYRPTLLQVPAGEGHKTLDTVAELYPGLLAAGLDRQRPVIALGGGVVGDLAGFAAATFLRGVPFVPVPTTLLAMVDASVGGKTGVDLPQGKNLVGAFKQPELVLIDPDLLRTLPAEEFRAGLAEVVKHAIIASPELFRQLEEGEGPASLTALIRDAVQVKVDVVSQDPFERGRRAVLNLGHTFGHAIEQVSGYTVRHGEAVAVGLVAAADLAERLGRAERGLSSRVAGLLERLGLPTRLRGYSVEAVHRAMAHDKKRRGRMLRFVIPEAIGRVVLVDDPGEPAVRAALARVLEDSGQEAG